MAADNRLKTVEDELKLLKGEIKNTLLDMRAFVMMQESPFGRDGHTGLEETPAVIQKETASTIQKESDSVSSPTGLGSDDRERLERLEVKLSASLQGAGGAAQPAPQAPPQQGYVPQGYQAVPPQGPMVQGPYPVQFPQPTGAVITGQTPVSQAEMAPQRPVDRIQKERSSEEEVGEMAGPVNGTNREKGYAKASGLPEEEYPDGPMPRTEMAPQRPVDRIQKERSSEEEVGEMAGPVNGTNREKGYAKASGLPEEEYPDGPIPRQMSSERRSTLVNRARVKRSVLAGRVWKTPRRKEVVFEEEVEMVEEPLAGLEDELEDGPGYAPEEGAITMDVNLITGLVRWTSIALNRLGLEGVGRLLDLYISSGNGTKGLKDLVLYMTALAGRDTGAPDRGGEYVGLMHYLHGVLTSHEMAVTIPVLQGLVTGESSATSDGGSEEA